MFSILLVDDHADFRSSLSGLLRSQFPKIRVEEAGDGIEALDKLGQDPFDLVLMDVRLPGVTGITLTRLIKSTHAAPRVVILTGYDLPQYREAAFDSGADGFLYKGGGSCMNDLFVQVTEAMDAKH